MLVDFITRLLGTNRTSEQLVELDKKQKDAVLRALDDYEVEKVSRHPSSYYSGGYTNVTKCRDCRMVDLYIDQHPANPCRECGGKVVDKGAAKYDYQHQVWLRNKPKKSKDINENSN